MDKFNRLDEEKKELQKKITKLKSTGVGGGTKGYHKHRTQFLQSLKELKFSINSVKYLVNRLNKKEKQNLQKIAIKINKITAPNDLEDTKLKEILLDF